MLSYGNTPLSLSVWNLSIMDVWLSPTNAITITDSVDMLFDLTEEPIHLIGNIFKQLQWNGQLIWASYTSDGSVVV